MKTCILTIFILCCAIWSLKGQNLVLNPSFEDTVSLDYNINYQICKNWFTPNCGTSDYYSPYAVQLGWGWVYNAPQTYYGYQQAEDGEAFIGLDIYQPNNSPTKEYAQGFLNQPMIQGNTYYVGMYINLVDSSEYKTCEIEIAFTDTLIYTTNGWSMNFTDTVEFNISHADTVNWLHVTGKYTSHGGEKYIYIGSNKLNANITCIDTLPYGYYSTQAAYYFIDNVYVSENPDMIHSNAVSNINIYPNPTQDIITIEGTALKSYTIIDMLGRKYKEAEFADASQNSIYVGDLPKGMYFVAVKTLTGSWAGKVVVQ